MNAWTIFGFAGSVVSIPWIPRRVQTGVSEPNILCPVNVYPPSTGSARVTAINTGKSLPASPWPAAKTSPATASSSIQVSEWSPAR